MNPRFLGCLFLACFNITSTAPAPAPAPIPAPAPAPAPAPIKPPQEMKLQEQEAMRAALGVLHTRMLTIIAKRFPKSSEEEKDRILRKLVRKIKAQVVKELLGEGDKEDLLARML